MAKRAIRKIIEGIAVVAGAVWIIAPITPYRSFVAFALSTVALLAYFVVLRLLDDDAQHGWWPEKPDSNKEHIKRKWERDKSGPEKALPRNRTGAQT
jgi:hypothetical protein